jgi:hypothetical protein
LTKAIDNFQLVSKISRIAIHQKNLSLWNKQKTMNF